VRVAGGGGEGDVDDEVAAGQGTCSDGGVVGGGDGADNGQAKAVAVAAGRALAEAPEGLE
jgi:hypothetical protein